MLTIFVALVVFIVSLTVSITADCFEHPGYAHDSGIVATLSFLFLLAGCYDFAIAADIKKAR